MLKQLFTASPEVAGTPQPNLGRMLGSGSIFGLDGEEHRLRRKLLVPPFHGRRMQAYAGLIEEEFRKEAGTWPLDREFATLTPFMRITLNVILRAVFGADGARARRTCARCCPVFVTYGSRLTVAAVQRPGDRPVEPVAEVLREYRGRVRPRSSSGSSTGRRADRGHDRTTSSR